MSFTPDEEAKLRLLLNPLDEPVWAPKAAPKTVLKVGQDTYTSTNGTEGQLRDLLKKKGIL